MLRRDADTLQVGLDAPTRAVLADSPGVRRLLADLSAGRWPAESAARPATSPEVRDALLRLDQSGLLVPAARATVPGAPDPTQLGATAAWAGDGAERRLQARAALRVWVQGTPALRAPLERLLTESGLQPQPADRTRRGDDGAPALVIVVCDREPRRADLDTWVRQGVPHLLVWSRGGLPRVGPFVAVGLTACLRCLDAHESETDPRRPLLLEQAAEAEAAAADPVLACLATAWAARDVLRYAEGELPASWSAVVTLAPSGLPQVRTWRRHPHCGCAWDTDLYAAG